MFSKKHTPNHKEHIIKKYHPSNSWKVWVELFAFLNINLKMSQIPWNWHLLENFAQPQFPEEWKDDLSFALFLLPPQISPFLEHIGRQSIIWAPTGGEWLGEGGLRGDHIFTSPPRQSIISAPKAVGGDRLRRRGSHVHFSSKKINYMTPNMTWRWEAKKEGIICSLFL